MKEMQNNNDQNKNISFTADQRRCIDLRHCDLLVSAAAGSGKTAVLVERIIQIICDPAHPVDIDRLLVVTFTRAAAAQMREKIAAAIAKKLDENPGQEHLERQAALVHNAQITTIDSFCMFVIRNNFADIGLDPGFRTGDANEMKLFRADVLTDVLEQCYEEADEAFLQLAETFAKGLKEKALQEIILKLYEASVSYPYPDKWLADRENDYDSQCPVGETEWFQTAKEQIGILLRMCLKDSEACGALCEEPGGPHKYGERADEEAQSFRQMLAWLETVKGYTQLRALMGMIDFKTLPSIRKEDAVDEEKKEKFKALRDGVKERVKSIEKEYLFCSEERLNEQTAVCERIMRELVRVTRLFADAYTAAKREKNLLDFSDIEHLALQILRKDGELTPAALEYRKHFQYVMIDEYQDSNLVQEYLLESIAGTAPGGCNRFMVGDVKQSIYKFRLARPEIFLEKYRAFSGQDDDHVRVDLHQNFRSRGEVLDAVNDIFRKVMCSALGGISYDDVSALYQGMEYEEAPAGEMETEVLLYAPEEGEKAADAIEREARGVAVKIKELVKKGWEYRDIVILLRSASQTAETYAATLDSCGIPVFVTSRTGYFGTYEVRTLLQFLQIINNPLQDIPFYGVLHSVIGGLNDNEIALVRSADPAKKKTLYENCLAWQEAGMPADVELQETVRSAGRKLSAFLKLYDRLREYAVYMPVQELLRTILLQTDYIHLILAMPGGDKRLANVEMLLQKAADYEQTSFFGLFDFVRYMEQLEQFEVDFGEANTFGEEENVVRIMTIHASKGLEFPVCFVSSVHKQFNLRDSLASVIIDTDLGAGIKCTDLGRRTVSDTLRRKVLSQKIAWDDMAEELRVLYVALTRAKEKLIVTGACTKKRLEETVQHLGRVESGWRCAIDPGTGHLPLEKILSAKSMLDWILMSYDADARFAVKIVSPGETVMEEAVEVLNRNALKERFLKECGDGCLDEKLMEALHLAERQVYHHENLQKLYTKTSVTELKKAAMQETDEEAYELFEQKEVIPYLPGFMRREAETGGTERGTAYHRYMELFDFTLLKASQADQDMVRREMERMLSEGLLLEEHSRLLWADKLVAFLQSDTAKRMADAAVRGCLYREQPFVMGIEASRLDPKFPAGETVLIQGIIDVFWEEDGKYILLDYKTDRVDDGRELIARYEAQMDYYEEALSKMKGEVSARIIYSFGLLENIVL